MPAKKHARSAGTTATRVGPTAPEPALAREPETDVAEPPRALDLRPVSNCEEQDDYRRVLLMVSAEIRVIGCKHDLQWIVQRRRAASGACVVGRWTAIGYCASRAGLVALAHRLSQPDAGDLAGLGASAVAAFSEVRGQPRGAGRTARACEGACTMNAECLTRALGGQWFGRYGIARCPAHDDRNPSLSLKDGIDGRLLVHCFARCDFRRVRDELRNLGLLYEDGAAGSRGWGMVARSGGDERAASAGRTSSARRFWEDAGSACGTLAERYLRERAYPGPIPKSLRFLRRCWHPSRQELPALVAAAHRGGDLVAIHRIYLAEPGRKADVTPAKASLGPIGGAAVHLSRGSGPLVVAEGIETSLALLDAMRTLEPSVWAAVSAPGMEQLELPDVPGLLAVAPDRDARGRKAALVLAERAYSQGWRVRIMEPPICGDWCDLAMREATGC
jgi:hypothetical protein